MYLNPPRDQHGAISFPPLIIGDPMGDREIHDYRMFLLGIRDRAKVEEFWQQELARRGQRS